MTLRYLGPYTHSHYFVTVSHQEPQEYDEAHWDHSPTRFFGSPFVCVNGKPTASLSYPFIPQKIISSMWGFKSNLKVHISVSIYVFKIVSEHHFWMPPASSSESMSIMDGPKFEKKDVKLYNCANSRYLGGFQCDVLIILTPRATYL